MSFQILAGTVGVYVGHSDKLPWQMREGIDFTVESDTSSDSEDIPVVFDCEHNTVMVHMKNIELYPDKMLIADLH